LPSEYKQLEYTKQITKNKNKLDVKKEAGLPPIFGPVSKLVRTVFDVLPIIGPV